MILGAAVAASKLLLSPPYGERVVTRSGEWKSMQFPDGSTFHVSPNTELAVRYTRQYRRIHIRRGEALFEVAPDPSKPFRVVAGIGEAQAIGTVFRVAYAPPDAMQVTVVKGIVRVTKKPAAAASGNRTSDILLDAGQRASLSRSSDAVLISQPGDTRRVRWDDDVLVIDYATIGEVVAQGNLRTRSKIVIDEPSVASIVIPNMAIMRYSPEGFAAVLAGSPNIAQYQREGEVHLSSKPGACAIWLDCGGSQ